MFCGKPLICNDLMYDRSKWVIWVILDSLQGIEFVASAFLVCVELKINPIREIILVHGHALNIMTIAYFNSNLGISRITKIQIRSTRPNINNTVRILAAL